MNRKKKTFMKNQRKSIRSHLVCGCFVCFVHIHQSDLPQMVIWRQLSSMQFVCRYAFVQIDRRAEKNRNACTHTHTYKNGFTWTYFPLNNALNGAAVDKHSKYGRRSVQAIIFFCVVTRNSPTFCTFHGTLDVSKQTVHIVRTKLGYVDVDRFTLIKMLRTKTAQSYRTLNAKMAWMVIA